MVPDRLGLGPEKVKVLSPSPPTRLAIAVKAPTPVAVPALAPLMVQLTVPLPPVRVSMPLPPVSVSWPPPPLMIPARVPPARMKLSLAVPPVRFSNEEKVALSLTVPTLGRVINQVFAELGPVRVSEA